MSADAAIRAAVDAAVAKAIRTERDRLARILLRHGLRDAARDVECCDDEGDGVDLCPACDGTGRTISEDRRWTPLCWACGGDGMRPPRVTA